MLDAGTPLAFDAPMLQPSAPWFARVARALFALTLFGAGCDIQPLTGGNGTTTGTQGTTQFCTAACTAQQKCDSSIVLSSCESGCASTYGPRLAHLRSDWTTKATSCVTSATCAAWNSGTAMTSCQDQASAAISPGSAAQSFCTQAVAKDTACGQAGSETQASCEEIVKSFDDATLNSAAGCLSQDCSTYTTCVRTATGS